LGIEGPNRVNSIVFNTLWLGIVCCCGIAKLVVALKRIGHRVTRDVVSKVTGSVLVKMSHIKTNRGRLLKKKSNFIYWKSMWDILQNVLLNVLLTY
jgi:hypothetical protein